jgi:sigma-E factor negative regulatory protein RseB
VPSLLAMLAVLGHEQAAPAVRASGVAVGGNSPPSGLGMRLLGKSAAAGTAASYQGVELIAERSVSGSQTIVSNVWHRGGLTVTQTSNAGVMAGSQPYVSYDVGDRAPEGVFGLTKTLVALLGKHYVAVYQGTGLVAGRSALIVKLQRPGGGLAARFWLDKQTMVPLRRDVYDTSAQLVSEEAFVQVQFGALTPAPAVAASATASAGSGWAAAPVPAQLVTELNRLGWQLPATLPGGLPLYTAAQSQTGAGQVVDLCYSDGLSVVSLFVQRGTLAPKPAGWQQVSVLGHQVYVAGQSVTWSGGGFVYTMLADAPPQVVSTVVASMPQETTPGVIQRIKRGLERLGAVLNPFR